MTADLVAFLRARLDGRADWADRVLAKARERGWENEDDAWDAMGFAGLHEHAWAEQARRELREVEAKRRIIDLLDATEDRSMPAESWEIAKQVRATMALPYADHPDYRDEWRP